MDSKRVLIAVVLSMAVLLIWNYLFPPPKPAPQKQVQQEQSAVQEDQTPATSSPDASATPPAEFKPAPGKSFRVETPEYIAVFNSSGGLMEQFSLKEYKETLKKDSPLVSLVDPKAIIKAPMGLIWNQNRTWSSAVWSSTGEDLNLLDGDSGSLVFTGKLGDIFFERTLRFKAGSYAIEEDLRFVNSGSTPIQGELSFTAASLLMSGKDDAYNQTKVFYHYGDTLDDEADVDDLREGLAPVETIDWSGIGSNYFLFAVAPQADNITLKAKYDQDVYRVAVGVPVTIGANAEQDIKTTYYLGPKEKGALQGLPNNLEKALSYGFFDVLSKPLISGLIFLYSYVKNYGVAIIIITIIIKILLWPLSQKSYKSMEKMKKIQPMMAKIREKYKDDRQKMNQEMMQLYKTYKVNPAGGCLPMLLQIPVFFGLYQGLLGAIELRHAPFITHLPFTDLVWLADLSAKDPYYITPIIMGATMFLQQKMTPAPGDPTQAKIMLFMPIVFTFLFLSFPSGLVLYWMVNNILSIGQQWMLTRKA